MKRILLVGFDPCRGWYTIDHVAEDTDHRHGKYSDGDSFLFGYRPPESLVNEIFRYPVLIDAVIQSSGVGMIGQTRSTYALLAGRRVRDWQMVFIRS